MEEHKLLYNYVDVFHPLYGWSKHHAWANLRETSSSDVR